MVTIQVLMPISTQSLAYHFRRRPRACAHVRRQIYPGDFKFTCLLDVMGEPKFRIIYGLTFADGTAIR